jgi:hypothetical protein
MYTGSPEAAFQSLPVRALITAENFVVQRTNNTLKKQCHLRLMEKAIKALVKRLSAPDQNDYRETLRDFGVYNPVKQFTPLILIEGESSFDFTDPKTSFVLEKGQPFLGIHLLGRGQNTVATPPVIQDALERMAVYLTRYQDILSPDIIGITHVKLAKATRRYGFQITETPLPSEITKRFIKLFTASNLNTPYDLSDVRFCYHSRDKLIAQFPVNGREKKTH